MKAEEREQMSEKDSKAIHNLFYEFHTPDNLGLLKSKLADYVATVRQEARAAAFQDAIQVTRNELWADAVDPRRAEANKVIKCVIDALEAAANSVPKEPKGVDDDDQSR